MSDVVTFLLVILFLLLIPLFLFVCCFYRVQLRQMCEALQGSWQGTPDRVLLEVAQTNESARALYESCGFLIINRRKNYYMDSDALIMERKERSHET